MGPSTKFAVLADAIDLEIEAKSLGRRGRGKAFREMTPERRREIASQGGKAMVAKHGLKVGASQLQAVTSKAGKASAAALRAMPEAERIELIRRRNAKSWETRRKNKAMKEIADRSVPLAVDADI